MEAFNTASANATKVGDFYFEAPGAALQQAIVNQVDYLGQLLNNPGSSGEVLNTIGGNLRSVFQAATLLGDPDLMTVLAPVLTNTTDLYHTQMFGVMTGMSTGVPVLPEALLPLVNLSASPLSAVLIGLGGPFISPVVALVNSVQAIMGSADLEQALQALIATPANVVGSFFNGATLNLDALVPLVDQLGVMPDGMTLNGLSLAFGGLFSPGLAWDGNPVNELVGGSIFNSLGFDVSGVPGIGDVDIVGHGIGPIAALANLSQLIAKVGLGWDGTGNPLTDLTFPQLDDGTTSDLARTSADVADQKAEGETAPVKVRAVAPARAGLRRRFRLGLRRWRRLVR